MNLVIMHFTNPVSWVFMPQLIKRAREFSEKHHMDLGPDLVEEAIRVHFVAKKPLVFSVCVVDGATVVGHLIASVDTLTNYEGHVVKRYLTILQAAHEAKDADFQMEVLGLCREWAKANYCDSIQILCEGEWRVKLFRDKYGFRVFKTVMHLDLED